MDSADYFVSRASVPTLLLGDYSLGYLKSNLLDEFLKDFVSGRVELSESESRSPPGFDYDSLAYFFSYCVSMNLMDTSEIRII